jgi:hypothetical protein
MDLFLSVVALAFVSAVLLWTGLTTARRCSTWVSSGLAIAALGLTVAFAVALSGRLALARFIPLGSVIVLGNWVPLGAAVLAGVVAGQQRVPRWRRVAIASMLSTLAWYTVAYDLLAPAPKLGQSRFNDGFCLQTSMTSCSACSGAALLLSHQIPSSEQEMVDLCLSRWDGTPELGLYRGLRTKTQDTEFSVAFLPSDIDEIRRKDMFPAVFFIDVGEQKGSSWWRPECTTHSIVVFGISDSDKAVIGDPSSGMVRWTLSDLKQRWRGDGLYLVPRTGAG